MREEKTKSPSQKNKRKQRKSWFWPAIYSGIAIVFVGMIWGYTALIKDAPGKTDSAKDPGLAKSSMLMHQRNLSNILFLKNSLMMWPFYKITMTWKPTKPCVKMHYSSLISHT